APFQRYGDAPRGAGVGLGLAVARGFAEAMGGTLNAEDTPGGGLTMVLTLRAAGARPGEPPGPGEPSHGTGHPRSDEPLHSVRPERQTT
ncbi:ATP-binding protein, partial [Streptomyces chartreusis]